MDDDKGDDPIEAGGPLDELVRFRRIANRFARMIKRLETPLELAIVGSVAGNDPYPYDLDLALALSDMCELKEIARCARQVGAEHPAWDIFIFDKDLSHLGRLCQFNECPKGKDECRAVGCGQHAFVKRVLDFVYDEHRFFSSPMDIILSPLGPGLFLGRQKALGIVELHEYPVWQPITLRCYECGEDFLLDGGSRKYFDRQQRPYPTKCEGCYEREIESRLESE